MFDCVKLVFVSIYEINYSRIDGCVKLVFVSIYKINYSRTDGLAEKGKV
jgi:hypothetical protein